MHIYVLLCFDTLNRLQKMSNSCVRYIYGLRMRERITRHTRSLGWIQRDTRRMYFAALLMYKIYRSKQSKYLPDLFRTNQPKGSTGGERKDCVIPVVRIYGTPCRRLCVITRPSPAVRTHYIGISWSSTDSSYFVSMDGTNDDSQMKYDACSKKHISFTH